jgi:hypothetical protein
MSGVKEMSTNGLDGFEVARAQVGDTNRPE